MTKLHTLLIILVFPLFVQSAFGQEEEVQALNKEIESLKQRQRQLSSDNAVLFDKVNNLTKTTEKSKQTIDSLESRITTLEGKLVAANEVLSGRIDNTNDNLSQTNGTIDKNQRHTILYILISVVGILLILFLAYFTLKGRQRKNGVEERKSL